jgi:23S rRNA (uracil1939-C5)-methyltransferase
MAARVPLLGMVQCIQPARTGRILSGRLLVRTGVGAISQSLLGRTFRVSAASFFQVNSAQAAELCHQVIEHAEPQPGDTVLDLYSGVGLFTLTIAPSVRQVKGIEVDRGAVEDARANAQSQGQDNVEFVCGDVDRAIASPSHADIVLLDPPRKGCAPETLDHVAGLRARRIVYVSCNPATLARDLARLHQLGYETRAVTAIDMFPQTFHIEAVAALAPRGA